MGMLRKMAVIFGLVFLAIGVMGYIPSLVKEGSILGYLQVDPLRNNLHLVIGVFGFIAAVKTVLARLYFQIFGVVCGVITILGFLLGGDLYFIQFTMLENVLHAILAAFTLYLGYIHQVEKI